MIRMHRVYSEGSKATSTTAQKQESDDMMDQKEHAIHPIVTRFPCCISSHQMPAFVFRECHVDVVGRQRLVSYVSFDTDSINHHLFGRGKTVSCRRRAGSQ